jgi:hypothetical protein
MSALRVILSLPLFLLGLITSAISLALAVTFVVTILFSIIFILLPALILALPAFLIYVVFGVESSSYKAVKNWKWR